MKGKFFILINAMTVCIIFLVRDSFGAQTIPSLSVIAAGLENQLSRSDQGLTMTYKFYSGTAEKKFGLCIYVCSDIRHDFP